MSVRQSVSTICDFLSWWRPCADFQLSLWIYQPIASEILTQSSRYKRAERNYIQELIYRLPYMFFYLFCSGGCWSKWGLMMLLVNDVIRCFVLFSQDNHIFKQYILDYLFIWENKDTLRDKTMDDYLCTFLLMINVKT